MLCQDDAVDTANGRLSLKHVLFVVTSNLFAQISFHSYLIAVQVEALRWTSAPGFPSSNLCSPAQLSIRLCTTLHICIARLTTAGLGCVARLESLFKIMYDVVDVLKTN